MTESNLPQSGSPQIQMPPHSQIKDEFKRLLETPAETYLKKKEISKMIDVLLGSRQEDIEKALERKKPISGLDYKTWIGFDSQSFQTTYHEFTEILNSIDIAGQKTIVDIGSAYGRLGIVKQVFFPELHFIGCEIVKERLLESVRLNQLLGFEKVEFSDRDVLDPTVNLPEADYYFIYDFSTREDFALLLEKMRLRATGDAVCLLARGRGVNHWIYELAPWLSQVIEPVRHNTWTLYRSR